MKVVLHSEVRLGSPQPLRTYRNESHPSARAAYSAKERKLPKGEIHVIIGMFANVQSSMRQVDADSETNVHSNTQQNLLMRRKICIDRKSHSVEWSTTDTTTENSVGSPDPIPSETSWSREHEAEQSRFDDKVSHIRSTQKRLCDDRIETRLKQNREVTEQREDATKRGKCEKRSISSDEEEMRTWRQVEKCEIKWRNVRSRQSVQTSWRSAENNTSFWVRWRTYVFSQVFSKSFL